MRNYEETIENHDYSQNSGFLFTNRHNLLHQGADAEYIGEAVGVAEKRLFILFANPEWLYFDYELLYSEN
ncbi:hypothetical protein [Endozoicomonas sp. SCSIO W0465]|uniref:hypothetical protein n=1 Tax=Endozoicomonas sp. SCSIO W0465 TaxID=2918516 RepID=UPI0020758939|nr:hypothetical protein [Endozoicomonas sp. SCSIO W0465]USE36066.1 hypothetical protein MJO57_29140 [Endozoicomonas sp. SCSIO W0465]